MKDEYIIINKTGIQKRIEELETLKRVHCYRGPHPNESEFQRYSNELTTLKNILSQSSPLIPEIEKAYVAGEQSRYSHIGEAVLQKDYISNLKLDI